MRVHWSVGVRVNRGCVVTSTSEQVSLLKIEMIGIFLTGTFPQRTPFPRSFCSSQKYNMTVYRD